jgi:hypothetical protein
MMISRWGQKKNLLQILMQYNNMKRAPEGDGAIIIIPFHEGLQLNLLQNSSRLLGLRSFDTSTLLIDDFAFLVEGENIC